MKKFIASAGLVTVSAVGLHAAYAPGLSPMETSKPWSVSAALRGFYDDNYNNAPSHPTPGSGIPSAKSSGGMEIAPSLRINLPMDQTYVGASYNYSLKYYFDRKNHEYDQMHEFTLKAEHRFNERYKVSFDDSFVYSVEPELIDSSGPVTAFSQRQRDKQDAIRNRAKLAFSAQVTELLGAEASYQNTFYHYFESGPGSLGAELNRDEHLFDLEGTWHAREHLTGLVGYQFGIFDYTSNELLSSAGTLTGNDRDNYSHYFYLGLEHAFSSQFNGSVRGGAQYTSYRHLDNSSWSPYFDIRGTYTYLPGSYAQFGFTETRNATDVTGLGGGATKANLVKDQQSSTLFALIHHRITPRVTGSVLGQFQSSSYSGGSLDGKVDNYFLADLNLEYRINPNWAAEIGYSFDRLDSDVADRSFTRNRVYGGVRASF